MQSRKYNCTYYFMYNCWPNLFYIMASCTLFLYYQLGYYIPVRKYLYILDDKTLCLMIWEQQIYFLLCILINMSTINK